MVLVSSFDRAQYMWQSLNFMIKVASTLIQIKAFLELQGKYVQGYKQAYENYSDFIDSPSWHPASHLHRYAAVAHYKDASSLVSPSPRQQPSWQ